jgi:hypothetical protein
MKRRRRDELLVVIATCIVGVVVVLTIGPPGWAQVGIDAHPVSATPDAVPRSRSADDGAEIPTAVPPGIAGAGTEDVAQRASEAAARDPIRNHFSAARQTMDALPGPQQTALVQASEASRAAAATVLTLPPGSPTAIPPLAPAVGTPAGTGTIIDERAGPPHVRSIAFRNYWRKDLGPYEHLNVWAGEQFHRETGRTGQGVVLVGTYTHGWGGEIDARDQYPTPQSAGEVRIIGATVGPTGDRLTLQSTNGTIFIFDVASRTFLPPAMTPGTTSP